MEIQDIYTQKSKNHSAADKIIEFVFRVTFF